MISLINLPILASECGQPYKILNVDGPPEKRYLDFDFDFGPIGIE